MRHFPVTEITPSSERLVSIVSKYDIARGFPDNLNPASVEVFEDTVSRKISTVMTKNVITTTPDWPIEEASEILRSNRINALPVLREGQLVGIITTSDIFTALVAMTSAKSRGVRVVVQSDTDASPAQTAIYYGLCPARQTGIP